MSRPIQARIDLNALRHNYLQAKKQHGGKTLAVIKANAYGHGAITCAKALMADADAFAVASIEEAKLLREAQVLNPILLLEGFFEADELTDIVANDCWLVIHAQWQLDILLAAALAKPLNVWLKVDTGMHRLGFSVDAAQQAYMALTRSRNVNEVVMMTHFANADNLRSDDTLVQLTQFSTLLSDVAPTTSKAVDVSLANSAAILAWQASQKSALPSNKCGTVWSRPGLMLYGVNPLSAPLSAETLKPVMTLESEIIAVQSLNAGESIGYGGLFTASQETRVGVVACGYADGYPRLASNAPVMVAGVKTSVIGRVSMDMLFVDITEITQANVGSTVELFGQQILASEVAASAGSLAYEMLCNIKRVAFKYET